MNVHAHRLLALILSLAFGCNAWAGGGNGSVSVAPICHRSDCRPGQGPAVRVQGALLQAAALSVASASLGRQGSGRPGKDLPRRHQTRLPSWYKRSQAAQLRGQAVPVAASVQQKMPIRARVREAKPTADIPDLTIRSEDRELASDSLLQGSTGEAVFGSRPPVTDDHPGENHTMIGNVSGTISNHSSNAPARVRSGGLSHSGARTVLHTATALSLISPRRAAPGRSAKSRTAVPTRPHEQLSVPGLRQKDVGKRKSGVRVRESGGEQVAHAGKKGKVKDRTQPARPAGGRTGSTAANPFESASSMKTAGPRSEARGAHHRHLVQESMDIEQDALDRQMRDLDLDDDMESGAPAGTMGTEGEELASAAGPGEEKARERRQVSGTCPPLVDGVMVLGRKLGDLRCLRQSGVYSIQFNTRLLHEFSRALDFSIPTDQLTDEAMEFFDLTLVDSNIYTQGSITFFDKVEFDIPFRLTIRNSTLEAGKITLAKPGADSVTDDTMKSCNITLKIEGQSKLRQSKLQVAEGGLTFIQADHCKDARSNMHVDIGDKSSLTSTNGDINLVNSLNNTHLDVQINNAHLSSTNGNVVLVGGISGSASNMTLSMNNSTLTASGTPLSGTILRAVPVGSIQGDNTNVQIINSRGNTLEARLTEASAPGTIAIASLGWIPTVQCGNGNTLRQSNLTGNTVRAIVEDGSSSDAPGNKHTAYASLAGVYRQGAESCWRLEQSKLKENRVEARTQQGTSLASLGVIRDADRTGEDLYISQEGCTKNNVTATAGSAGTAVSSLTLAEKCGCSISFTNACNSTAEPVCAEGCSLANVTLTQCGMDGNRLIVGNSSLGTPSLLVSRGLLFPLSISGNGTIECTGNVAPAECLMRVCGNQTACPQPPTESTTSTTFTGTPEDGTSTTPGEDSGDNLAALGSLALLLPASCGALMTIGVCAAYHKKRQQKAQYSVREAMDMESRFVGEKAADKAQAAAEPSALQWHKGDDQSDPDSDEEASDRQGNLYEGVKDAPAAHF